MLTQEQLKQKLSYDPETGDFTWLVGTKMIGKKAGSIDSKGYCRIQINGKFCKSHRLAWLYVYGEFPSADIDHVNGVRNDNRIKNLRDCSRIENMWNVGIIPSNTSGFKGVVWRERDSKWQAQIKIEGKSKHIGYFATAELASAAYKTKARELHGEFYRNTN